MQYLPKPTTSKRSDTMSTFRGAQFSAPPNTTRHRRASRQPDVCEGLFGVPTMPNMAESNGSASLDHHQVSVTRSGQRGQWHTAGHRYVSCELDRICRDRPTITLAAPQPAKSHRTSARCPPIPRQRSLPPPARYRARYRALAYRCPVPEPALSHPHRCPPSRTAPALVARRDRASARCPPIPCQRHLVPSA